MEEDESTFINLMGNFNPASRRVYDYLTSKDIANLRLTSNDTRNIISSYILNNNNDFIKNQIYNVYIECLSYLIFSLLYKNKVNTDFTIHINSNNVYITMVDDLTIFIEIENNKNEYINSIEKMLKTLYLNYDIEYNNDKSLRTYIFKITDDNIKLTYLISNLNLIADEKYTLDFQYEENQDYKTYVIYNYNLQSNQNIIRFFEQIPDLLNPTKMELIKLLKLINIDFNKNNVKNNIVYDLGLKFKYLFKNKDVLNFLDVVL